MATRCNGISLGLTDDNRVMAGRAGAIETVVSAMKTHSNNAGVCEQGRGAVGKGTTDDGGARQHTI